MINEDTNPNTTAEQDDTLQSDDTTQQPQSDLSDDKPKQSEQPDDNEVFTVPRWLGFAMVSLTSLLAGIVIGGLVFGGIDMDELAITVNRAVASAVDGIEISGGTSGPSNAELADDDPALGPEDAPIVMVEFSDFNCPFCGRYATETFPQIVEHYGDLVRIVYRDNPIIGGQASVDAAIAAECAGDQGYFWEFHEFLFSNTQARGAEVYASYAQELGLNMDDYNACIINPGTLDEVRLDYLDAQGLGLTGTPGFYINGRFVSGAQAFDTFRLIIDNELERQGIEPPA